MRTTLERFSSGQEIETSGDSFLITFSTPSDAVGQVLMTRAVFDSARQVLKGEDIEGVGQVEWLNHGSYLLKGLDEPVEICEVREAGQEPLSSTPTVA